MEPGRELLGVGNQALMGERLEDSLDVVDGPGVAIRMPPDTVPEVAPRADELTSEVPATTFSPLGLEISPVTSQPYRLPCSSRFALCDAASCASVG